ncbi:MAG: hypothetical protein ACKPE1_10920 [Dolichospermum sp.]
MSMKRQHQIHTLRMQAKNFQAQQSVWNQELWRIEFLLAIHKSGNRCNIRAKALTTNKT